MSKQWSFSYSCLHCGGACEMQAGDGKGQPRYRTAMIGCVKCGATFQLVVMVSPFRGPKHLPVCGTDNGYNRHLRDGDPVCAECATAHYRHNRARRLRKKLESGNDS